ncbi:MAG: T9SS type A sorting domain-containing protein [Weeksellaceae bacterium]|nr:T9SS type A sorting domain-containing protein [Weeksellaceae bacterium]
MKKILFSCLLAAAPGLFFGQSVYSDDFEAATLGNLGTDITGVTPGQGGWYISAATTAPNSAASNFQVQNDNVTHGKVLSILGSNSAVGTKQINQNNKLVSVWGTRTPGNDILQYEFDVFSGAPSTSQNTARIYLWDASAANKCVVGFALNMATKQHSLIAYSDPVNINGQTGQAVGNWAYTFNTAIAANTWYKVGIAWDSVSGEISYKIINEATKEVVIDQFYQGAGAGATPNLANIQVQAVPNTTVTVNTVAAAILFDNIRLKATNVVDLLAVNDNLTPKTALSLYPNPFTDVLNISDIKGVKSVSIHDMSGREVKTLAPSTELNVTNLKQGVYIVNLKMEDGSVKTFKAIKK